MEKTGETYLSYGLVFAIYHSWTVCVSSSLNPLLVRPRYALGAHIQRSLVSRLAVSLPQLRRPVSRL